MRTLRTGAIYYLIQATETIKPGIGEWIAQRRTVMERSAQGTQILLIEDNPSDVRMLRYAFDQHSAKYQLHVLSDGDDAVRFVQEQRRKASAKVPCVIVLDLHLPKRSGEEVLSAIREAPPLSDVAVVVLTSFGRPSEAQQTLDLGAQLYRTKPIALDDWIAVGEEIMTICLNDSEMKRTGTRRGIIGQA